jgi:hypothetical protein
MACVIETKANIILDFIHGLRGELQVTFEEGTWATWLYDLLKPHAAKLVVCDPRKNSRQGNKNDRIDARELADRLYMNKLSSVYHGGAGVRTRNCRTSHESGEGHLSQLGYFLCRQASLSKRQSTRMWVQHFTCQGSNHFIKGIHPIGKSSSLIGWTVCPASRADQPTRGCSPERWAYIFLD